MNRVVRVEPYWYDEKDCLGTGSFGEVYKGHNEQDKSMMLAIKRIKKDKLPQKIINQEIQILQELSAPDVQQANFVTLLDYVQDESHVYLVMEYCNGGDLHGYLRARRKMDEPTIKIFLQQIASALKILHDHNVVHRDLKPANIILSHNNPRDTSQVTFKIADFGMGRFLEEGVSAQTFVGTPVFMAPEIFVPDAKYDYKADLWSIGAIVYQCATGTLHSAFQNEPIRFPANINTDLQDLVTRLLCRVPAQRISFNDFYNHKFIGMEELERQQKQQQLQQQQKAKLMATPAAAARSTSRSTSRSASRSASKDDGTPGVLMWFKRVFSIKRKASLKVSETSSTTSQQSNKTVMIGNRDVLGIAHLETRFYVLCRSPNVLIQYSDQSPFIRIKEIDISRSIEQPQDVAACNISKCLYVTDKNNICVWKVEVGYPPRITKWVSDVSEPHTISVNRRNGLVTTFGNQSRCLLLFDPKGELLSRISLPNEIRNPQHAVETSSGNFFVIYEDSSGKKHGVCEVSTRGKVLNRYDKLVSPGHLAIDSGDNVFVADLGSTRVQQLNGGLKFEQTVPSDENEADELEKPFRVCYSSNKGQNRLLVEHRLNNLFIFSLP